MPVSHHFVNCKCYLIPRMLKQDKRCRHRITFIYLTTPQKENHERKQFLWFSGQGHRTGVDH